MVLPLPEPPTDMFGGDEPHTWTDDELCEECWGSGDGWDGWYCGHCNGKGYLTLRWTDDECWEE